MVMTTINSACTKLSRLHFVLKVEVKNRNQRVWLTRYRTSAHNLRIESGRYTSPVTPVSQRVCVYCDSGECDTEEHAILVCKTFQLKR